MATDYRVEFHGDLGNLRQFSNSIRGAFGEIRNAYRTSATAPISSIGAPNLRTGNVTTQIDSYNRTLTQSGQVFHRYVAGWTADLQRLAVAEKQLGKGGAFNTPTGPQGVGTRVGASGRAFVSAKDLQPEYGEFFTGRYKTTVADLDKVEAAQARLIPAEKAFAQLQKDAELAALNYEAKRVTAGERHNQILKDRNTLVTKYNELSSRGGGAVGFLQPTNKELTSAALLNATDRRGNLYFPSAADASKPDAKKLTLAALGQRLPGALPNPALQGALASTRGLDALGKEVKVLDKEEATLVKAMQRLEKQEAATVKKLDARRTALLKKYAPEFRALDTALQSAPPIPKDLDALLGRSPQLRKAFAQKIGITAPYSATDPKLRDEYSRQLLGAGVENISVTRDFDKNIDRLSFNAKSASGAVGSLTTSLSDDGKMIEKWSGNLRGGGGFLRQTVKDFQKVVEWTVATTVVFGSLGVAFGSISKINQVNADLTRFSITAQTSAEETKSAFSDITQIAIATATPLQELVAVMDDIALATRRAGQTSGEWKQAMNALAESVGILTNLTGVDTVRATDLLSSAYKQLGILPQQLIPLLNKVTAVAGGNAQAIEDIVSALGGVSEAAKAAGLNVDQQIASVQVLSQVTNKTAADVATSFKNLFGSLSSVGAAKALAKFGIETRTSTGEMRDFLDVYKDIYDARQAGRISEGQLSDVLKGISGGPRRAPDAAALLANIPLIFETISKSTNATNEALIANARILDTNSAKLQQIRTKFDAALIQNFTDAVNELVKAFYDLGSLIGSIGDASGIVKAITQLGLLALAILGLSKAFSVFGRARAGFSRELGALVGPVGTRPLSSISSTLAAAIAPRLGPPVPKGLFPTTRPPLYSGTYAAPPPITYRPVRAPLTIPRPRPTPYLPVFRPTVVPPTVPGTPNPLGNRAYRRSALGRQQIANYQSPYVNPAAGLKPFSQQLKEEAAFRKAQLANLVTYAKTRAAQELGYLKIRGIQEAEYRGQQLSAEAANTKAQLAQMVTNGRARVQQEVSYRKAQLQAAVTGLKQQAAEESKYRASQLLNSGKGRLLIGAGIGAAVGGVAALAAGNNKDLLGTVATAGQGIGLSLALLGGPVGIGAGSALLAISTAMQIFNDEQKKAEERSKGLRTAVFDNIKSLTEERKALEQANEIQRESKKTIDELSGKKKLDADQTERLAQANKAYIDAILDASDANLQVLDSTNKLIEQIPQLEDKFKSLAGIANKGVFSAQGLKDLSVALSGQILGIGGVPNLQRQTTLGGSVASTVIGREQDSKVNDALHQIIPAIGLKEAATSKEVVEAIKAGGYEYVQKLLDNSKASPTDEIFRSRGFTLDQTVIDQVASTLSQVEDKNNADFQAAVQKFGEWVTLVASPKQQLSTYIQGSQAKIQAQTSLGILQGKDAENAQNRATISNQLLSRLGLAETIDTQRSTTPRGREGGQASVQQKILDFLYGAGGKGGFLEGAGGKTNVFTITGEEAKQLLSIIKEIDPAFAGLSENTDQFAAATYEFFSKNNIVIDDLKNNIAVVDAAMKELQATIHASAIEGEKGLYQSLAQLRGQQNSGEFKGKAGAADFKAQENLLLSQVRAYKQLDKAFQANTSSLDELKTALAGVHELQGINLEDTENLLPALIGYAQQLGLTGAQTDIFVKQIKRLLDNLTKIDAIRVKFHIGADVDLKAAIAALKAFQLATQAAIQQGKYGGGPSSYSAAAARSFGSGAGSINEAIRALEEAQRLSNQNSNITSSIGSTLAHGGTHGTGSGSGSGSGGGSGSNRVQPGLLDIPEEFKLSDQTVGELLRTAVKNAKGLQRKVPGETKDNRRDIVELLDGTKRVLEVRGVGEEYLRRAMDELAAQIKKQNDLLAKADTIRRIRVGAGDFAAIANVPINSKTGVSVGGANAINVTLNLNGTVLTPAQFEQFANQIGAAIKRQIVQGG